MKKILFCVFLMVSFVTFGQKKYKNLKGGTPMEVQFLGVSPKLKDITPIPSRMKANENDVYVVPNKLTKTGLLKQGPNTAPDPVMQKSSPQPFEAGGAGQVLQGFDGASNVDNGNVNGIMVAPPDTQGDVGPNHYIQMVNSLTTIFDKSGNVLFGPAPNSVFFQDLEDRLAGSNDGDPVALYDQFADRWIVSQFAVNAGTPFAMLVAISTTPDPLGSYNQYAIFYGDDFPDYPKLGVWNDALYITTRDFNPGFIGFSIVALNRDDIINGVADARSQRFQITDPGFDGILPADADGTVPPPDGMSHPSLFMGGANQLNLINTTVDFDNPANSTLTFDTVPVAPFNFFATTIPQPNGQTLDALPFFLMYRLQYMNFGTHASMVTNHSVQEVAGGPFGVRWYEFRDTAGATQPWEVFQQGTFIPDDDLNRWMGSIAMNENGDIALGYSVSSATLAPSIRFAGQTASESGSGILNIPETSILEGTLSSNGTNRWGDYSMMSVDPVDQDFWFTTEYIANDAGFSGWGTFISEMTFGEAPTAICQDISVDLDADVGTVSITPEQIDNGSIDAAGGAVTLALDIDTFDCNNAGENIVTLTVTDAEGITASCTAVVTVNVIDTEAPVAVCQDIFVELVDGTVAITPEQVDGGSTDNCAIADLSLDQTTFTAVGTFTVTLTVTDVAGLTSSCTANVNVAEGASITVDPLLLNAAVDVSVDNPPVDEETFTITNNGGVPLEFDTAIGDVSINSAAASERLANLDRSIYGSGNGSSINAKLQTVEASLSSNTSQIGTLASTVPVLDSLFLDSGVEIIPAFVGLGVGGPAFGFGIRFEVPAGGFNLNAVRNAARTEDFGATEVLIQVFGGDALPDPTQLLTEQLVPIESVDGSFDIALLSEPQQFEAGDVFWIVNNYPSGVDFPQGFDDTLPGDAENYAITIDGGPFANQGGFAILTRALDTASGFISLSPASGSVAPGESLEVVASFDANSLPNGVFESDIFVTSNDALNPTTTIETIFTVSGVPSAPLAVLTPDQVATTLVVGASTTEELTLSNDGDSDLEFSFPSFAMAAAIANGAEVHRAEVLDFPDFPKNPEKGFRDTRSGEPVPFAMGTDLDFGYTWLDSDAPGGPVNNFMDITATGTDITADLLDGTFSDETTSVTLPFTFNFYGVDHTELFINGNGLLAFTDPTLPTFTNQQIPVDDGQNNIIAPFWDDLEALPGDGSVHVELQTDRAIVQWTNAPAFLATGTVTFQVVLFADGSIDMYYEDVDTADFLAAATIGIENADGNDGAQVAFNTAFIRDDFAIRFMPPSSFITAVSPTSGTLAAGAQQTLTVTLDATGLEPGVFTEDLMVSSNSEDTNTSTTTFELTVVGSGAEIEVDPLTLDAAVNLSTDTPPVAVETFTITNTGGLPLDFTTEVGDSDFTPADAAIADALANLDRSIYGEGNTSSPGKLSSVAASTGQTTGILGGDEVVLDSLFLDSGIETIPAFVGLGAGGPPIGLGIRFVVPAGGFNLNAVRNAARTEDFGATDVLLQVFGGDALPDPTQLLTEQLVPLESVDGVFPITVLNEPQQFQPGDVFWIVHNYPMGIDFPQGFDDSLDPDDTNYAFTTDGGANFANLGGFALLVRALNVSTDIVSLSPDSGTVAPGESVEVAVNFNGAGQDLGVFETDIAVNSNDPSDPTVTVATTFTVSGDAPGVPFAVLDPQDVAVTLGVGESTSEQITLRNEGDADLEFSFPEFIEDQGPIVLEPSDNQIQQLGALEASTADRAAGLNSKGLEDSRSGGPQPLQSGTDLNFGYTWEDSNSATGPAPVFFDISATGVDITDALATPPFADGTAAFTLPFTIPFYGDDNDTLFVNANGWLSFQAPDATAIGFEFFNGPIPSDDGINNIMAPFWDDLEPITGVGGTVHIQAFANAIVAQWTDAPNFGGTGTVTFQVVMFTDGIILFNYADVSTASFLGSATIGIENQDGTDGAEVAFNTPFAEDNFTIQFLPPAASFITDVSPTSGTLAPGAEQTVTVTVDATGFEPGVFTEDLTVTSNSEDTGSSTTTFELTVTDDAIGAVIETAPANGDTIDFGVVNVGESATETVTISNVGDAPLIVAQFDVSNAVFTSDAAIPLEIAPGGSANVEVTFTPSGEDGFEGDIAILSNDTQDNDEIFILLTGEGVEDNPAPAIPLILVNATTDTPIGPIMDGDVVNLSEFPAGTTFNIVAETDETVVESVVFDFNGTNGFRTENVAPFALGGDIAGDFLPVSFAIGTNTVTATSFSANGGGGQAIASSTINFELIDDVVLEPAIDLILINATTDVALGPLENGVVLDLADFPEGTEFSVNAIVSNFDEESIVFDLNGIDAFRIENVAPYAIAGNSGSNFLPAPFVIGDNTVSAGAFTGNDGLGTEGVSVTVDFEIIDSSGENTPPGSDISFVLINADTDTPIGPIANGSTINLADFEGIGLAIEAVVDVEDPIGSVRFDFNGTPFFRVENVAPYALNGDNAGNFAPLALPLGVNSVTAAASDNPGGQGEILASLTINFVVEDSSTMAALQVFPNPTLDRVFVGFDNGTRMKLTGTLFNFFGQTIYSNVSFDLESSDRASMDMSGLPQGVYVLQLRDENGTIVSEEKLVKK